MVRVLAGLFDNLCGQVSWNNICSFVFSTGCVVKYCSSVNFKKVINYNHYLLFQQLITFISVKVIKKLLLFIDYFIRSYEYTNSKRYVVTSYRSYYGFTLVSWPIGI